MTTFSSNSPASSDLCAASLADGAPGLPVSQVLFDAATVEQAVNRLAVRINVELRDANPVFVAVMHGGLPFASELFMRFSGRCELACVYAERQGRKTSDTSWRWHLDPSADLTDRTLLLVSDVLDGGETLAALRARAMELGAADIRAAVLVRKASARCLGHADYIALESPNQFLFGYGMALDNNWRNLREIRAVDH